jgi:uncharacterized membrane protein YfcA
LRNLTVALMTLVSIVIFLAAGLVRWVPATAMMAGAIIGGYGMAQVARRVPQDLVRNAILCWSVVLTGYSFWRYGG